MRDIKNEVVNIRYRNAGFGAYQLSDGRVRQFNHNEVKRDIPVRELEELTYSESGLNFLKECLVIEDDAVCEYLGLEVEPEYFYTEEDIKTLLIEGTEDQLLDCIDFAPSGVLELLKTIAVDIKINDLNKRNLIAEKLNYNVTAAITNLEYANEGDNTAAVETKSKRRAATNLPERRSK